MEALFGARKTDAERLKEYKRSIQRSVRQVDRERVALERQEGKLKVEIKKMAKAQQMESARVMAKDLVRTRGYIQKMHKIKSNMEMVSLRLQTMQSSAEMAKCMKGVTKVMARMNRKMNVPQIQKIMMEFEKQNDQLGLKEEIMGDMMDDAFADDDDEEEEENILNSVFAELGVEVDKQLSSAPQMPIESAAAKSAPDDAGQVAAGAAAGDGDGSSSGGGGDLDAELQKRLENLRRT